MYFFILKNSTCYGRIPAKISHFWLFYFKTRVFILKHHDLGVHSRCRALDAITHRRSCHPGTVVAVPDSTSNRVFIQFDGQPNGQSQLINRRECKKRPRVNFLLNHQIKHIKFIMKRLSEIHGTLKHRNPGQHYQKVICVLTCCFYCFFLMMTCFNQNRKSFFMDRARRLSTRILASSQPQPKQ